MAEYFGRRSCLLASLLLTTVSSLASAVTPNVVAYGVMVALMNIGMSGMWVKTFPANKVCVFYMVKLLDHHPSKHGHHSLGEIIGDKK